jgi:tripartite-type tricarboxylate transporter receptor subunit TctC
MATTLVGRRDLGAAVLASLPLLGAAGAPARAQGNWPSRPVALIVPYAAGGSTDAVARILAQRLSADLGQNVVVDNRSGATGTIGMALVARARPDGHTLALAPGSTFAMAPHLYKLPYDNESAFAGAGLVAGMPIFLTVPGASPVRDLAGFLELARRQGTNLTYGHAGAGSSMHLAAELFLQVAGIELQAVSYRGAAPAVQGMLGGETQMTMMPASAVMSFLQSGDVRALAVTTKERSPLAPEVPTFQELGYPGFEVVEHVAMLAPAGTPAPVLQRLNAACAAALRAPDMQPKLQAMAVTPEAQPLEAWPAYFRAESDKWREFVRARNIRVQ